MRRKNKRGNFLKNKNMNVSFDFLRTTKDVIIYVKVRTVVRSEIIDSSKKLDRGIKFKASHEHNENV